MERAELSRAWIFSYEGAEFLFYTWRRKGIFQVKERYMTQANPFLAFGGWRWPMVGENGGGKIAEWTEKVQRDTSGSLMKRTPKRSGAMFLSRD